MFHRLRLFFAPAFGCVLAMLACAASAADDAAPLQLTAKDRVQILSQAADAIEEHYLDKMRGREISEVLRARSSRSELRHASPVTFAREATSLLFKISGDRHLSLKWMPSETADGSNLAAPVLDHGIRDVSFLPGNIGFLRLDGFHEASGARESLTAALFLLRTSDALIFDFRENRGGASDAVRLLQSCFFGEPTLVMYYEDTPGERTPSLSEAPQDKIDCRGKPFYILTSALTASAAEDFIYTADLLGHGTMIGETTSGAANFVSHKDLGSGFRLAVSVGRPVHPETGTNWEGVGVRPDITVPPETALDRARFEALQVLHGRASGRHKDQLLYHLHRAKALAWPVHLSNGDLKTLVGSYASVRITLTTKGLLFEDPARAKSKLTPLSETVFQAEGRDAPLVVFTVDEDNVRFLELLYPDGTREIY